MYLPCQAELIHHSPQLIHIPLFFFKKSAGRHFSPYQCSAAQLRRRPLKLLFSETVCVLRSGTSGVGSSPPHTPQP